MVVELEQERTEGKDREDERDFERRKAAGDEQVKDEQEERPENQVDGFETEDVERTADEGERREECGKAPRVRVGADEVCGLAHRERVALDEFVRFTFGDGNGLHEVRGPVVAPLVVEGEEGEGKEEREEDDGEGKNVFFHCALIIRQRCRAVISIVVFYLWFYSAPLLQSLFHMINTALPAQKNCLKPVLPPHQEITAKQKKIRLITKTGFNRPINIHYGIKT